MGTKHGSVLVVGPNSFLGKHLVPAFSKCLTAGRDVVDLSQPDVSDFVEFVEKNRVSAILMCASMTNVDDCFKNPELSKQVNYQGYRDVLNHLKDSGVIPVLYSSINVFSGDKEMMEESDPCDPKMVYGRHKLMLEEYISSSFKRHLIFRTARILSDQKLPKNPIWDLHQKLAKGQSLSLIADRPMTPVYANDVVHATKTALEGNHSGIFHLASDQSCTWLDLGRAIQKTFELPGTVQAAVAGQPAQGEPRPRFSTLSNAKARANFKIHFSEPLDLSSCRNSF